jgi:hypothetical protein
MKRTIVRLFDEREDAMEATRELERTGVPHADISVVASNRDQWFGGKSIGDKKDSDGDGRDDRGEGAVKGATTGGLIGAGAGLLAGLGLLAIPGLGPVVAAGWLASTATGAAAGAAAGAVTGGLIGALTREGVPEDEAHVYAEGVKRGGTLVTVRTDDDRADQIESILDRFKVVNASDRAQQYRSSGWSRFDETAPPA